MQQEPRRIGRPRASEVDVPTAERILAAAARLFLTLGFDGVSTEAVAGAAGVTKAMVYYYYASKTNLFAAAVEWMMDRGRQRTYEILHRPVPLRERLQQIAVTRLRIAAPLEVDAMMQGSRTSLSEEERARIERAEHKMLAVIATAFEEAAEAREIRKVDPMLAARVFMAVLMIGKSEQAKGLLSDDRVEARCGELVDLFWSGVEEPSCHATE